MREVPGFKGFYATQDGKIFDTKNDCYLKIYIHKIRKIPMARVKIGGVLFLVNHLVASAYLENSYDAKFVEPINGNHLDTRPENLRYIKYTKRDISPKFKKEIVKNPPILWFLYLNKLGINLQRVN